MYLEYTCADINIKKINEIMKNAKKISYFKLKKLIKKELPDLYNNLSLQLFNPFYKDTFETTNYYILTHSATNYFIKK